jgi:hypothetical protein
MTCGQATPWGISPPCAPRPEAPSGTGHIGRLCLRAQVACSRAVGCVAAGLMPPGDLERCADGVSMGCAQASILLNMKKPATSLCGTLPAGIPAGMVDQPTFGIARAAQVGFGLALALACVDALPRSQEVGRAPAKTTDTAPACCLIGVPSPTVAWADPSFLPCSCAILSVASRCNKLRCAT